MQLLILADDKMIIWECYCPVVWTCLETGLICWPCPSLITGIISPRGICWVKINVSSYSESPSPHDSTSPLFLLSRKRAFSARAFSRFSFLHTHCFFESGHVLSQIQLAKHIGEAWQQECGQDESASISLINLAPSQKKFLEPYERVSQAAHNLKFWIIYNFGFPASKIDHLQAITITICEVCSGHLEGVTFWLLSRLWSTHQGPISAGCTVWKDWLQNIIVFFRSHLDASFPRT